MTTTITGLYRNHLAAEIEITGIASIGRRDILGLIYSGVIRDDLFGDRQVLVEPAFLSEVYTKVEDSK